MSSNLSPKDIEVDLPPQDSISSLSFSGRADYLAVGSWDKTVRVYEVSPTGQSKGKAMYSHSEPVLDVCWNAAGDKIFSGGTDNIGLMFDSMTGQVQQVAQHEAPIKSVEWVPIQSGLLATGGWDKTIKYWDLRTSVPVASVALPERLYSMDVLFPLMVVGTAERHIQVFDLKNPSTPIKSFLSPLKWQTRVVSCCAASSAASFAIGSIEGRVAIQFLDEKEAKSSYTFRCHRTDTGRNDLTTSHIYAVNDISFHPVEGTFSTCGSDGAIHLWDKDSRTRLRTLEPAGAPISASGFNRDGKLFAYAVSYDWSKGHKGMTPDLPINIFLRETKDEMKRRPRKP